MAGWSHEHATIAIPEDLDEALAAEGRDHGVPSEVGSLVEAALRTLSAGHRYLTPFRPSNITPIEHDGNEADLCINHDRYGADGEIDGSR